MQKLLACAAISISLALLALMPSAGTTAAPGDQIYMYLYHPTGNSSNNAILACGYHDNCDGDPSDPNKVGLDWVWPGFPVGGNVYLRLRGQGPYPGGAKVADAYIHPQTYLGCPGVSSDINRVRDGLMAGKVRANHTDIQLVQTVGIYAGTSGLY